MSTGSREEVENGFTVSVPKEIAEEIRAADRECVHANSPLSVRGSVPVSACQQKSHREASIQESTLQHSFTLFIQLVIVFEFDAETFVRVDARELQIYSCAAVVVAILITYCQSCHWLSAH